MDVVDFLLLTVLRVSVSRGRLVTMIRQVLVSRTLCFFGDLFIILRLRVSAGLLRNSLLVLSHFFLCAIRNEGGFTVIFLLVVWVRRIRRQVLFDKGAHYRLFRCSCHFFFLVLLLMRANRYLAVPVVVENVDSYFLRYLLSLQRLFGRGVVLNGLM